MFNFHQTSRSPDSSLENLYQETLPLARPTRAAKVRCLQNLTDIISEERSFDLNVQRERNRLCKSQNVVSESFEQHRYLFQMNGKKIHDLKEIEIKHEYSESNLIEVKPEASSISDAEIPKIEGYLLEDNCNVKNEVLDVEADLSLVTTKFDIKQECSSTNLIEVKPEPLLPEIEIQKIQETYRRLIIQEDNCKKQERNIKNEIVDMETNLSETKCMIFEKDDCVQKHSKNIFKKSKRKYECPVCQKHFTSSKWRLKHFNQHFKKCSTTCTFCGKESNGRFQFWNHYKIHLVKNKCKSKGTKLIKSTAKPFQCKICLKQFTVSLKLNKHLKLHKDFSKKINLTNDLNLNLYKCDICFKEYHHQYDFCTHLKTDTNEKSFESKICLKQLTQKSGLKIHIGDKSFKCVICLKQFTRKSHLKRHLVIHSGERNFKCEICLKQFIEGGHLKQHLKIHTGEKPFKCDICLKQFTWKKSFNAHLNAHTGEKSFKCEICFKEFVGKSSLKYHLKIHTSNKSFTCAICLKQFTYKSNLKKHLKIHSGERNFKCEICLKQFIEAGHLKRHLKIHTGEKPWRKTLKCAICLKQFIHRKNLKIHLNIHTGEKSFKCEICLKQFPRQDYLKNHLINHTGQKSCKCEICFKQFTHSNSLKRHLKIHSSEK